MRLTNEPSSFFNLLSLKKPCPIEVLGFKTAGDVRCALEVAYSHGSADNHEIFLNPIHGSTIPPVAFVAKQSCSFSNTTRGSFSNSHGRGSSRSGFFNGKGRGRRLPRCQLCRMDCHYAKHYPDLASFASAIAHMTPTSSNLDSASNYASTVFLSFGNGNVSDIFHIGTSSISKNIKYLDVLVDRQTKEIVAQGRREEGLYVLEKGQRGLL
ncbi:hypothetical protein Tco_1241379 [Tanacetum coccineum]